MKRPLVQVIIRATAVITITMISAAPAVKHPGFLKKGIEYFVKKDFNLAQDMLENAIPDNRENPVLWKYLGNTYFANRHFNKAIDAYKRAIELAPGDPDNYINLAESYTYDFQNDKALTCYQKFEKMKPNIPDTHLNIGYLYAYRFKVREKVIHHWLKYLKMRPDAPQKPKILAYLKNLQSMTEDQKKKWQKDVENDPRQKKPVIVVTQKDDDNKKEKQNNQKDNDPRTDKKTAGGKEKQQTHPKIRRSIPRDFNEYRRASKSATKVEVEKKKLKAITEGVTDNLDEL